MKSLDVNDLPDDFCPVPFTSLIFNPDGIVGSCREKGSNHKIGNILEENWQDIWNNEKLRSWRREFLEGNIVTCKKEIKDRNCHKHMSNQVLIPHIDLNEYQKNPPLRISPDFNGKCNLTCNMCWVYKKPNGLYDEVDSQSFWDKAKKELFPFVMQLDPLAGEPFIQKDFYRLIEITKNYDPKPDWTLTTNGYWDFNASIKNKLNTMSIKHITVSMDAIDPKIFKKIRNGHLHKVVKTVMELQKYQKEREQHQYGTFILSVNFLVQSLNAYHLPEFMVFIENNNLPVEVQVEFEPEEFSIMSWDENQREDLLKYYLKEINPQNILFCHRVINTILNSFKLGKKKRYLQFLDLLTNKHFSKI